MVMTLDQAVEASEIVDGLKRFGVTQAEVAAVAHVSVRGARGWQSVIRTDNYDRLAELRDIVLLLSDSLSPRGVAQWLRARNRLLDRERPIDVLAAGGVKRVHSAAEAFIDGCYE